MNLLNSALSMRSHGLRDGIKSPQKWLMLHQHVDFLPDYFFFMDQLVVEFTDQYDAIVI